MKDYIEAIFHDGKVDVKYVSSQIKRGRRIALYGIGVAISKQSTARTDIDPVIPSLTGLMEAVEKFHDRDAFRWSNERWEPITVDKTEKL